MAAPHDADQPDLRALLDEVRQLRAEVAQLRAPASATAEARQQETDVLSRRRLLGRVGTAVAATAGASGAAALLGARPAAAAAGDPLLLGTTNATEGATTLTNSGGSLQLTTPAAVITATATPSSTAAVQAFGNGNAAGLFAKSGTVGPGILAYGSTRTHAIRAISKGTTVASFTHDATGTALELLSREAGAPTAIITKVGFGGAVLALGFDALDPVVDGRNLATGTGVYGSSGSVTSTPPAGPLAGVLGAANHRPGVAGVSDTGSGVEGRSADGVGVVGSSGTNVGVKGTADAGNAYPAVHGEAYGSASGVKGSVRAASSAAPGVFGATVGTGSGVRGEVSNAASNASGVLGLTAGTGAGVTGQVVEGAAVGVLGTTAGSGSALRAAVTNAASQASCAQLSHAGSGLGLQVEASTGGGASFKGAAFAVRLVPRSTIGAPTSGAHKVGELVVDAAGALYLCTVAGTPGTWRPVLLG